MPTARKIWRRLLRHSGIRSMYVKQKTHDVWAASGYRQNPVVSFVIQSHNKSRSVVKIVEKLRAFDHGEIIVIDDGSRIEHTQLLADYLDRGNEFLLRCNDLYEVITYDRAIWMARGAYVALLQDDDSCQNLAWVADAVRLFEAFPKLAILGGRGGGRLLERESTPGGQPGTYSMQGDIAQIPNVMKYELTRQLSASDEPRFIQWINRAPMWVRRSFFLTDLQHIDQSFAPFQCDDIEICLRTWLEGAQVALYHADFDRGALGEGGMRVWNSELGTRQVLANYQRLYESYGDRLVEIDKLVKAANETRVVVDGGV